MFEIDKEEKTLLREARNSVWFYIGLAVVVTWSYLHFGCGWPFVAAIIFGTCLLILSLVDLKHFILPDTVMIPTMALGLILPPLIMEQHWANTFLGGFLGFGLLFAVSWGFFKIRGYHGMGFGDVKLLGALGAWTGASSLPPLILISSVLAMPVFILRCIIKGTKTSQPLPFGPFLAVGGWLMFLYDIPIWAALLQARKSIIMAIGG
jgi:leader peptidase (prepilin peptidase)/N-methyltransferase